MAQITKQPTFQWRNLDMSTAAEPKAVVDPIAKAAADKAKAKADAKKKAFSSGLLGFLGKLTPDEIGRVYTFFHVDPANPNYDKFLCMEAAYAKYGDDLLCTIDCLREVLSGKYVAPAEETK
jgi:hypothetical protein